MVESNELVSARLDDRFTSETGLYGRLEDLPLAWQAGHHRRSELLAALDIGDVRDKVCLDFGTGSWGFAGIYPRLHDCQYAYGMDISPAALEQSRKLSRDHRFPYGNRVEYLQSDGLNLPLPEGSVDLIFAGEAIEHIRFPRRFLRECHRILREGGQLVLTTPNRDAILYRLQRDLYCVGPEHFWLFNHPELVEFVSEYFQIVESLGFNGSVYRDMDNALDLQACNEWAAQFLHLPEHATGLVMRGVRKPGVTQKSYDLRTIPSSQILVTGALQTLPLEFGMKGTMIQDPGASISFVVPPCEGVILHFWTHAWSGYVRVTCGQNSEEYSLFTKDPGWRPIHLKLNSRAHQALELRAAGRKDDRALSDQVIFFEAAHYAG